MKKTLTLIVIALICSGFICGATLYLLNKPAPPVLSSNEDKKDQEENKDAETTDTQKKDRYEGLKLIENTQGIPVLCYHAISNAPANADPNLKTLYVSPENFKKQMQYLKDNGYFTMTMDEFYDYYKNGAKIPEKSVLITFDDGYEDNYTNALPVIKDLGLNATVFMISGSIGTKGYMTAEQVKEMDKSGFEVQSHTVTHSKLSELTYEKQVKELADSKATLEKLLNKKIEFIAYPESKFNDDTKKACKETNYKIGFNLSGGAGDPKDAAYNVDRTYISGAYTMDQFKNKLVKP